MTGKVVWITAEGYQELHKQLEQLRTVKRPLVVSDLQDVSGGGDWRESAQFINTQNELEQVDNEAHKLEELLDNCQIVAPHSGDAIVEIGETVVLQMNGDTETYTIVSPAEAAPDKGRISYESPVGNSLLNHKVGDDVTVTVPAGIVHCRIVAVR